MDNTQYGGWTLYDDIILVVKKLTNEYAYRQAYIVDPKNKKSLETARKWGTIYTYNGTHDRTEEKPEELRINSRDFELELSGSANNSGQGGKLSFWNCILRKDDREFLIGINSDLLLCLLKQSNCVNGKIKQKVIIARNGSCVGVLHRGMEEYKVALADLELKKITSKKTNKHNIGQSYKTLYKDSLYIGDIYQWFEMTVEHSQNGRWGGWSGADKPIYKFRLLEKPIKKYLFIDMFRLRDLDLSSITTISELYKQFDANVTQLINRVEAGEVKFSRYDVQKTAIILSSYNIVDKLPNRAIGSTQLINDNGLDYNSLVYKVRQATLGSSNTDCIFYDTMMDLFGCSENSEEKLVYTADEQTKIMEILNSDILVDFGDGVQHHGTAK